MRQIIGNEQSLMAWLQRDTLQAEVIKSNPLVLERLTGAVHTLDKYYGADRDLEKDMGGYTVILYGTQKEIVDSHKALIAYHHLNEEEYEYEETYLVQEYGMKVVFRLYLCSNDYGIEEVIVKKVNKS